MAHLTVWSDYVDLYKIEFNRFLSFSSSLESKSGDMGHEKPCHFIEGYAGTRQLPSAVSPSALSPSSRSPFPGRIMTEISYCMRIYLRLSPFRSFPSSPTFSQKAGGHGTKPCHFIEGYAAAAFCCFSVSSFSFSFFFSLACSWTDHDGDLL